MLEVNGAKVCVTSFITEAEYVACVDGVKGALLVCAVLELPQPHLRSRPILVLSKTTRGLKLWLKTPLARPAVSALACVITSSLVRYRKIKMKFVSSVLQHADTLTKDLAVAPFNAHAEFLVNSTA